MDREDNTSFGVFKPVGHVVISLPDAQCADEAAQAIAGQGIAGDAVHRFSDREMVARIEHDMKHASPIAAIGQELNLVRAHRELADRGYHFLVVRAENDEQAAQIAAAAERCGAERAQHYGHFIIEELIERPGNLPQVGESPDRGLDAQTPTGEEAEAARLKAREEGSR